MSPAEADAIRWVEGVPAKSWAAVRRATPTIREKIIYAVNNLTAPASVLHQAELNLRSLKTVLQMDVLRGKRPEMVRKEIWAHFLAYNLIRKVMAQAAQAHEV